MNSLLICFLLLAGATQGSLAASKGIDGKPAAEERFLAIFAHPDDESTMAGTLARAASDGAVVQVVSVTSGQQGGPKPGEALGRLREAELRAACKVLGLNPPILLGFQDGTLAREKQEQMKSRIDGEVRKFRPTRVFTFGPDGFTSHPDHIAVGKLTTQVVRELFDQGGTSIKGLYHVALPRSKAKVLFEAMGATPSETEVKKALEQMPEDDRISFSIDISRFRSVKLEAAKAHSSQFPEGEKLEIWKRVFGSDPSEYFIQIHPLPRKGAELQKSFY